jgi:hypothetical protein
MTRIVQCLSHSIESYDQLRLYTELGYEAIDIGGYIDPRAPHDAKRPPVPDAPFVPEIKAAIDALGTPDNLGAAQEYIPDAVLEWLGDDGVLIYHHYLDRLWNQWPHIRDWMRGAPGRRVVWRTVGQSVEGNELAAQPFRADGLSIIRYSPKERNIPGYAGEDALIRFYKDPDEWNGWVGHTRAVINITQHLRQRDPYTNWQFWDQAVVGRPWNNRPGEPPASATALGPGSEEIGGVGELTLDDMKRWLRSARCYLYTGTQPASYTLGLIEAMMTGIPVVSIGPSWMNVFPYGPDLFEGHEIAGLGTDSPEQAREWVQEFLDYPHLAKSQSAFVRERAVNLFGKEAIGRQWAAFLG